MNTQKLEFLLKEMEDIFIVSKEDILSAKRNQELTEARAVLYYILRAKGWTWSRIGRVFNKHHTTVIYNHQKVKNNSTLLQIAKEYI